MKNSYMTRGLLFAFVGLVATMTLQADDASSRYSYTATRGAWPVSTTPEEVATKRYIETPPALSDLMTLEAMKAAIASTEQNNKKKYMAVLFTGWDWCERGSRLLLEWRKGIGEAFVTTVYDWPETDYIIPDGDYQGVNVSARSRENAYAGTLHPMPSASSRAHVWPAIALYDGEGKLFALERGVEYMSQTALQTLVTKLATNYEAYLTKKKAIDEVTEETFATAAGRGDMGMRVVDGVIQDEGGRTLTLNIYKAALLADALIELEDNVYSLPLLNSAVARKVDFDQIAAWDPEDVSGATRRIKNNNLFSTAEKYREDITLKEEQLKASLADLVDNTRLIKYSDNEYQQALLCGFNLYKTIEDNKKDKDGRDYTTAEVYARRAIAVNPASFWGEGARGRLRMLTGKGPVTLGFGWTSHNLTQPLAVTGADNAGTISAETIVKQDALSFSGEQGFKWVMRYGNDFYLRDKGWYNLKMEVTDGAALTIESIKIYKGTANLDDPTQGTLLFDGTEATNRAPTNRDDMASFKVENFKVGLSKGGKVLSATFYWPEDTNKTFPLHEKDWSGSDKPKYNDVAIVIEGLKTGLSSGKFTVNPVQTATAATAPNATQIVIDGATMELSSVLDEQRKIVDAKMPAQTQDGAAVANAVEALLTGDTRDEAYITALTRAMLFYEYESEKGYVGKLSEVAAMDQDGVDVLNTVMKDRAWLTDLLISGPCGNEVGTRAGGSRGQPGDLLHRLALLWRVDKIYTATYPETRRGKMAADAGQEGYDPLIRRMATVGALNAAPIENGNLGQTHWVYREQLDRGVMHGDFFTQSAAQMRLALNPQACHVLDVRHAVTTGSTRVDQINGTAWQSSYLLKNFFGDSIFGSDYFKAWDTSVVPNTALGREIGAVCGGISHYGMLAAIATGRRSVTGGQPGHCAATHRSFDGTIWEIDSNVGSPTGSHFPLWKNYSYYTFEYYDDMWDDPRTLIGYYLMWSARLRALAYGETDPGVEALYHRAVTYAPLCYQAILDYRDFIQRNYPNDADRWLVWAEAVTNGMWRYPSLGWSLLNNNLVAPLKAQYGELGALAAFKQLHARMHDSNRKTRETYNYIEYVIDPQTGYFNDTNMISLVATALDARYGTPRFNNLVNWGNSYYATGSLAYTTYQTMLQSVYEANGNPLGVKATCLEALMDASKSGNLASFNEMCTLYVNLFQDAEYPILSEEVAPYDYPMVSADGLVTLSSYPDLNLTGSEDDLHASAQAYCHAKSVINNAAFGTYSVWTQPQTDDPWVMVQLPGDAEIFGVIVQNGEGSLPLVVEISADAQNWTTLVAGRTVGAGETLNVTFNGSTISKYVRVRYPNTTGGEVRLKLNKLQVFAKKRY